MAEVQFTEGGGLTVGRGGIELKFGWFYALVTFIVITEALAVGWSFAAIFPAVAIGFTVVCIEVMNTNSRWNILLITVAAIIVLWQVSSGVAVITGAG